ncbi:MAG: deoxyribose-phosphate aldolase [Romboutsia sp.]|nr:deoxyribose-phosphate aldolase [Romboutsia sp.]
MENKEILSHVDHTLLKATSTEKEIDEICKEALRNNTAAICIPPAYIKYAKDNYPTLNIATVIGFPLGYNTTAVKVFETKEAIKDGANEIDMVINIGWAKDGLFDKITDEIRQIKNACEGKTLKVIIETCYLNEEEKIALCRCVSEGGADYIKTSTGFGTAGAKIEDIKLFKEHIAPNVKIKAAGGIRTKEDMEAFIKEGSDRIGCSAAVKLLGE